MEISIDSDPLGPTPAEPRLQAALVDVTFLQAELDRTYQALTRIGAARPKGDESGCS
jgi:hypothetical protein